MGEAELWDDLGTGGGVLGERREGSISVGGFEPGGILRQWGEEYEGLFEGFLSVLSPEVRKSDIWRDLDGVGIPDFELF